MTEMVRRSVTTILESASVGRGWRVPGVTIVRQITGALISMEGQAVLLVTVARVASTPSVTRRQASVSVSQV